MWNATDPNGEVLTINISYSPDAGNLWCPIAYNLPNTGSYTWNTEDVPDGYDYKVKVDAFDGNLTTSAQSKDVFTVYNKKSHEEAPGFHYNAGFSLSDAPNTNETLWITEDIDAQSSTSLIVADGKVFVYCFDSEKGYGGVKALDALNGSTENGSTKPIWSRSLCVADSSSWATAAYHDGSVFVASGNNVYRLDAEDGHIIWSFTFPDDGRSMNGGPCVAYNRVYVGSWDGGHYYCLDEESGNELNELWPFALYDDRYGFQDPVYHHAQSTPAAYSGKVFFGDFYDHYSGEESPSPVYAVNAYTGEEIWNQTVKYPVCGSLTVAHGKVYLSTFNFGLYVMSTFYALNQKDGEMVWNHTIFTTDSTPAHAYGNVYLSGYLYTAGFNDQYKTYCLSDAKNGEEVWNVSDVGYWTYSPVVADKKVFVGTADDPFNTTRGIYALNAFTGEEIWHSNLGGGSPAILNGRLYTVDEDGKAVCFGSKDKIDLTPTAPDVPDPIYAKQNYTVNATILNLGPDDASAFNVSLRIDGDIEDETRILKLIANSSTVVSFEWRPEKAEKNCTLVVEADCCNEIVETDPLNNKLSRLVDVLEGKDIAVLDVGCADEVLVGDISVEPSIDAFYLEGEDVEVELLVNGESIHKASSKVRGERVAVSFTWSPSSTGVYNLTVVTDPDKRVDEVNEGNNRATLKVTVIEPTPTSTPKTPGFGPGSGGGIGGGSAGGIGEGSGTGEAGAGEAGGMQIPVNASSSASETKKEVLGFPFGNATSGASGGGGTLPILLMLLAMLVVALFYFGYYKEKRAYRRNRK
jgi:outer membrane protein assembly factor BamB